MGEGLGPEESPRRPIKRWRLMVEQRVFVNVSNGHVFPIKRSGSMEATPMPDAGEVEKAQVLRSALDEPAQGPGTNV